MKVFVGLERITYLDERWYKKILSRQEYFEAIKNPLIQANFNHEIEGGRASFLAAFDATLDKEYEIPEFFEINMQSVTSFFDVIAKGKQFLEWYRNTKDPLAIFEEAGQLGTDFHDMIYRVFMGEEVEFIEGESNSELWMRFMFWCEWWKEFTSTHKIETLEVEKKIYDLGGLYGGTLDWVGMVDSVLTVCDWKSGSFVNYTAEMQVAAYAKTVGAQQGFIVQCNPSLTTKKKYKAIPLSQSDLDIRYEQFKVTQKMFWINSYEDIKGGIKPKSPNYPKKVSLESIKEWAYSEPPQKKTKKKPAPIAGPIIEETTNLF
jgi:hypothetical protein